MLIANRSLSENSRSFMYNLRKGKEDFVDSCLHWRIVYMLGISEIKKRYLRSKIGQFWLTMPLAINICSMGLIWAYLFKISVMQYLPFIATGTVLWQFIASCINEGTGSYIASSSYIYALNLPKLIYINSLIVRNIITTAHNLILLIIVYIYCGIHISVENIVLFILCFFLTILFLYPLVVFLALVSLRFRDVPNIVTSLMQVVFYLTPIMWKLEQMPAKFQKFILLNPLAVLILIWRNAIFSTKTPYEYWLATIIYIILAWLIALPIFIKFRSRIVYWL